jgi:hypothetical protein
MELPLEISELRRRRGWQVADRQRWDELERVQTRRTNRVPFGALARVAGVDRDARGW